MSGVDELDHIRSKYHDEYAAWLSERGLSPELENAVALVQEDPASLLDLFDRLKKHPEFISGIKAHSCSGNCGCTKCKTLSFFGDPFKYSDAPDLGVPSGDTSSSDEKKTFGDWAFKFMDIVPDLAGFLGRFLGKKVDNPVSGGGANPPEENESKTPWFWIGIGIVALLVIVFAVIYFTRDNGDQ